MHRRIGSFLADGIARSASTVWWLARIMVPASFVVFLMDWTGLLYRTGVLLEPITRAIGLPGDASIAILSAVFVNLYAVLAMVPLLALTNQQLVILALVTLVAHNFLVEIAVTRRTGTAALRMLAVRTIGAMVIAIAVGRLIPDAGWWVEPIGGGGGPADTVSTAGATFANELALWAIATLRLFGRIAAIVAALVLATRLLRDLGLLDRLAAALRPFTAAFGLPRAAAPAWIIANVMGLAYGAAVLLEEAESGRLSAEDGDLLNHHLAVNHSMLEDTLLFVALGAPPVWLIVPRLALAWLSVWERRLERAVRRRNSPVPGHRRAPGTGCGTAGSSQNACRGSSDRSC